MTTSEFIEILKKADPSGDAHIRMEGGIPLFAELKPGYWDGPYSYIDKDDNYVYTSAGSKVDIYCVDIWDFVERNMNRNTKWEEIEKKFKFELTYSIKEHRDERANSILKQAKEAYSDIMEILTSSYNRSLEEMIKNAEKGWKWFQNKDVDKNEVPNMHKYYTWKIFDENGKEQGSNIHMTESIQDSGLWSKLESNEIPGYYEWKFNNKNKNKNYENTRTN